MFDEHSFFYGKIYVLDGSFFCGVKRNILNTMEGLPINLFMIMILQIKNLKDLKMVGS